MLGRRLVSYKSRSGPPQPFGRKANFANSVVCSFHHSFGYAVSRKLDLVQICKAQGEPKSRGSARVAGYENFEADVTIGSVGLYR